MPISRPIALVTATALSALLSAAPLAAQNGPTTTTSTPGGSTTTSTPGGSTTTSTPGGSTTTSTPGGSTTTSTPGGSTTTSTPGGSTTTSTPGGSTTTTTPDGTSADIPTRAQVPDTGQTPGALTLTVPDDASVNMGAPRTQGDRLRFDADMPPVTITDTRTPTQAGSGGWEVTGEADDFTTDDGTPPPTPGGDETFGAEHLGWIPWADSDGRMGVEPGPIVNGVLRGGPGLAEPATLVSATSAGRTGAATAGAHLILEVPTDTAPGEYHSSIHLSLFPVD